MKFLPLTAAVSLLALSGLAHAQNANPFSPPAPPPIVAPPPVVDAPAPAAAPAPPPAPVDNSTREEVQGSRIGTINGVRIYRGSNTYVFEDAKENKLTRVPARASASSDGGAPGISAPAPAASAPAATASRNPPPPKNLPSMVGKPAPKQ
ncbi:hypothetical protein D3C71_23010 [compost metagenome]